MQLPTTAFAQGYLRNDLLETRSTGYLQAFEKLNDLAAVYLPHSLVGWNRGGGCKF